MKLKNNVETAIQVLNVEKGNFIYDSERNSMSKENFNHFIIVHTSSELNKKWIENMNSVNGFDILNVNPKKRPKNKKEDSNLDEAYSEGEFLNPGEEIITMDQDEELNLIRRERKINISSISILADDNWFLCPIYEGVNGLYPILIKKLPNKKGYELYISKVELVKLDKDLFTQNNFKEWNCRSRFILERYFDNLNMNSDVSIESIYIHKRENKNIAILRNALRGYEIAQKAKIRKGNILISSLLNNFGQNLYILNKENLVKQKEENIDELDEKSARDEKILDKVIASYKKFEEKLIEKEMNDKSMEKLLSRINKIITNDKEQSQIEEIVGKYISKNKLDKASSKTIRLEKTFIDILDIINKEEEEEALKTAESYMAKYKAKYPERDITLEDAIRETRTFRTKDYIPDFITYKDVSVYMNLKKTQDKAEKIVHDIVHKTWLWNEYAEGVKGMGEMTTAYLLAYVNFHATMHSSSLLKYLGLDQVFVTPEILPNQVMTHEEATKIIRFIYKSYMNILDRSKLTGMVELNSYNFDPYFKTDVIPKWYLFNIVKNQFEQMENLNFDDENQINAILGNEQFKKIVDYIWSHMVIDEIPFEDGSTTLVVKKRARKKGQDKNIVTYLDSAGNIKTKQSLGYNSKLKSKFVYITFSSLSKASNQYYIEEIYKKYKEKLINRFKAQGKDTESMKGHISSMARRHTIQIFLTDIWKFARRYFKLPLNGEGFNDNKIAIANHIHNGGTENFDNIFSDEK